MLERDAFTLIEILIVMAILGILASVGYGQFASFSQSWSLNSSADSLNNVIRRIGNVAREENRAMRVVVNLDDELLEFEICNDPEDCDIGQTWDWETFYERERLTISSPVVLTHFTEGEDTVYNSGEHAFFIGTDGIVKLNDDDDKSTFFAIHLANEPAPATSERCEFRTVAVLPNTIRPVQYEYGRYNPFPESPANDC